MSTITSRSVRRTQDKRLTSPKDKRARAPKEQRVEFYTRYSLVGDRDKLRCTHGHDRCEGGPFQGCPYCENEEKVVEQDRVRIYHPTKGWRDRNLDGLSI